MKPQIGIPSFFVRPGQVGGGEYLFYNLVKGLSEAIPDTVAVYEYAHRQLKNRVKNVAYDQMSLKGNRFYAESVAAVLRNPPTMLFPNYFTAPVTRSRSVTVIYDAQYRHLPQYFSGKKRAWLRASHWNTINHADEVVAISECVRSDLIQIYGRKAERVRVVPVPIDWTKLKGTKLEGNVATGAATSAATGAEVGQRPYFLTVSAHYPHKNLDTLVRAFIEYRKLGGDHDLVLVGTPSSQLVGSAGADPMAQFQGASADARGITFTGHIDDASLATYYQGATALLLPSLFEGFGMPAVEALGLGVPVVASAIEPLLESSLGQANYCDRPKDHHAWREWMFAAERGQLHVPTAIDINKMRQTYDTTRIGQLYADICLN